MTVDSIVDSCFYSSIPLLCQTTLRMYSWPDTLLLPGCSLHSKFSVAVPDATLPTASLQSYHLNPVVVPAQLCLLLPWSCTHYVHVILHLQYLESSCVHTLSRREYLPACLITMFFRHNRA